MITNKHSVFILIIMLFVSNFNLNALALPEQHGARFDFVTLQDTIRTRLSAEDGLDKVTDLKSRLEKSNSEWTVPTYVLTEQKSDDGSGLSDQALYWARKSMDPSLYFNRHVDFRDTIIVSPYMMPLVFRKDLVEPEINITLNLNPPTYTDIRPFTVPEYTLFEEEKIHTDLRKKVYSNILLKRPDLYAYTAEELPDDVPTAVFIRKEPIRELPMIIKPEPKPDEMGAPAKFIPDRMYWKSNFESAIQFSQNHVTPNWHLGGASSLNLFAKNYLRYDYNKDKVQLTNELESKASIFNSAKDTLHRYKIGEDIFRLHSNFGYKAYNNWYYTLDGEFSTQLFKSFEENKDNVLASFLAPYKVTFGLGMKYDLNKTFDSLYGKSLQLTANMAPLAYKYMYSRRKEMDLGRHGFKKDEETGEFRNYLSEFGSTFRVDFTYNINTNISWQSRLYYFTTYDKVIMEFENTLILAITRHFSTRLYAHLRFDDGVVKTEDFDSYFQLNELISFGFNYRW